MTWLRGSDGHPSNMSAAEDAFLQLLHRKYRQHDLREAPFTSVSIVLSDRGDFFETRPDFYFARAKIVVYLDGPHHLRKVHEERDEKITMLLWEQKDLRALRFAYERVTNTLLTHWYEQVQHVVNGR